MDKQITYAVDFETTYDDVCSIKPMGWDAYFRHELFEAYLVTIEGSDGFRWVGHPIDAPWHDIKGGIWISHNASFDENLYRVARELGWWGDIPLPAKWHCTSDMVAYLGHPRSLKDSCKEILRLDISKEVRTNMKGLRPPDNWPCVNKAAKAYWKPMTPEFWEDVLAYAIDDSVYCLQLWNTCSDRWPEHERWLSDHTRVTSRRGIPVDIDLVQEAAASLRKTINDFENQIPWRETDALLSRKAFDAECAKCDPPLLPPKSLAKDSAEADQWLTEHEPDHPWIYAYRNWRRANSLLKKVESVERASRKVGDHYRYFGGLMYCGAHTKRWSGSGGNLNIQNMPRDEMFGVRFRDFFKAPEGRKLAAIDLSQIEVRTLTWLSRDTEMLEKIKNSPDIYQAFAEKFKLWDSLHGIMKKENPALRNMVKPVVLGSGFGASAFAFADKEREQLQKSVRDKYAEEDYGRIGSEFLHDKLKSRTTGAWWWEKAGRLLRRDAKVEVTGESAAGVEFVKLEPAWKVWARKLAKLVKDLERDAAVPINPNEWDWDWENVVIYAEAEYCVNMYRSEMKAVLDLWDELRDDIKQAVWDRHLEYTLPSGNVMQYRNVRRLKTEDSEGNSTSQILCSITRNGRRATMKPWYGTIVENCLVGGTEVATERGWVRLDKVTPADRVFDGVAFRNHDGVICKGVQPVIECHGVWCTPDHRVLVGDSKWFPADSACALPLGSVSYPSYEPSSYAPHWENVRDLYGHRVRGNPPKTKRQDRLSLAPALRLRGDHNLRRDRPANQEILWEGVPAAGGAGQTCESDARDDKAPGVLGVAEHAGSVPTALASSMGKLRGAWYKSVRAMGHILRGVLGGHGANLLPRAGVGQNQQLEGVHPKKLPLVYSTGEQPQQAKCACPTMGGGRCGGYRPSENDGLLSARPGMVDGRGGVHPGEPTAPVYDIVNCGPLHRFVVRGGPGEPPLVVHNCAQALARDVFGNCLRKLEEARFMILFHVHDEAVLELDAETAEEDVARAVGIMRVPPDWIPSLPVDAEGNIGDTYTACK